MFHATRATYIQFGVGFLLASPLIAIAVCVCVCLCDVAGLGSLRVLWFFRKPEEVCCGVTIPPLLASTVKNRLDSLIRFEVRRFWILF